MADLGLSSPTAASDMVGKSKNDLANGLSGLEEALPVANKQTRKVQERPDAGQIPIPDCFAEIQSKRASQEPAHFQQVAALEAVRMTLSSSKSVNETTYLVAIALSTERLTQKLSEHNELSSSDISLLANLLYLASLAIPAASVKVVQVKSSQFLGIAIGAATMAQTDAAHLVRRHAGTVVASTLAVLDAPSWSSPIASQGFNLLLGLMCDSNPKVRRRARDAVDMLFVTARSQNAARSTMSSLLVACTKRLLPKKGSTADPAAVSAALQLLPAIEGNVKHLRQKERGIMMEQLLGLASANSPHLTSMAYRMITAIIREVPDSDQSTFIKDLKKVADGVLEKSTPGVKAGLDGLVEFSQTLNAVAVVWGRDLLEDQKIRLVESLLVVFRRALASYSEGQDGATLSGIIDATTSVVTASPWLNNAAVLQLLVAQLFDPEVIMNTTSSMKPLKPLLDFIELSNCPSEEFKNVVEDVIKRCRPNLTDRPPKALRQSSREVLIAMMKGGLLGSILAVRPITFDVKSRVLLNGDLLPWIRDHAKHNSLALYFTNLAPQAEALENTASDLEGEQAPIEAKNLRILVSQVVSTIPSFCTSSREWHSSVPHLEKVLIECAVSLDTIKFRVATSALKCMSETSLVSSNDRQTWSATLSRILPQFITILTEASPSQQDELCESITISLKSVENKSLAADLLVELMKELSNLIESGSEKAEAAIEAGLAIALSKSLPADSKELNHFIGSLYPIILSSSNSATLQKRCYKTIYRLLESGVISSTEELSSEFLRPEAITSAATNCRSLRMKCLKQLVQGIDSYDSLDFFSSKSIVEVVLGCREASSKTREASFALLLATARRYRSMPGLDIDLVRTEAGLQRYLKIVAAGLAARNPPMIAATLAALARLVFEYRGEYRLCASLADMIDGLIVVHQGQGQSMIIEPGIIPILMRHESLEAVRAATEFLKVMCVAMPAERLTAVVPIALPSLLFLSCQSKNELRIRARFILERMVRKCTYEAVASHFPEEHVKLIASIRKELERNKKKKERASQLPVDGERKENMDEDGNNLMEESLDINELLGDLEEMEQADGEESDDNLDLLESLPSEGQRNVKKRSRTQESVEPDRMAGFGLSADGRPIFNDLDAPVTATGVKEINHDEDESDDDVKPKTHSQQNKRTGSKRGKPHSGEMYKNKKGRGDVRKDGQLEPFAFVPFGPKMFADKQGKKGKAGPLDSIMKRGGGSRKRRKPT